MCRPAILTSLLKVHDQFGSEGSRLLPVTCYQPFPNPLMQTQTPCCRYAVVNSLLVERMNEIITRRYSLVWLDTVFTRSQPLSTPCQSFTLCLDLFDVCFQTCGHDRSGKLIS